MPKQIDLEPHEFQKQDPEDGRFIKKEDPKVYRNFAIIPVIMLTVAWFSYPWPGGLWQFAAVAVFGVMLGVFLLAWLGDHYW